MNRPCNEFLTNKEIDTLCEAITKEFEEGQQMEAINEEIGNLPRCPEPEPIDIENATIEELRKKYHLAEMKPMDEMFEDPDNPHGPCPTPLMPGLNFDSNEDVDLDPTGAGALGSIAGGILSSGLELK